MRKLTNPLTTSKLARLSVVGAGGALLISTLSGCSVIEGVVAPKAWAITYQLEVEGEGSDQLTGVNYGDTDGPVALDGETITTTVGNVTTDVEAETTVRTWGVEAIIAPKQPAWVEATPAPGAAAKCVILIDGEREIQSFQGGPGEPVMCKVDTPDFPK